MNHLKHIRGINVRHCTTSNAVLPSRYGQCDSQSRSQLSKSLPVKKNYGSIKHPEQHRQNGLQYVSRGSRRICKHHNKTSVTSLKKKSSINNKLPLQRVMGTLCYYSTDKNAKFHDSEINNTQTNKRHTAESAETINGAKNINCNINFVAPVEKQPRSYAEMISDYSEAIYNGSTIGTRNDSLYFNNTIRKSPFSTLSVPPLAKKMVNVTENSEVLIDRQENKLPVDVVKPRIRHNNINTAKCHNSQHHDTHIIKTVNKSTNQDCIIMNNLKSDDQSYARLIADCSKSMRSISLTSISNGALVLKKNMLVKNFLQSFTTSTRKVSSTNVQETLQKTTSTIPSLVLEKNMERQVIDSKEDYWSREIENVMIDLKNITERKTAKVVNNIKSKDSDTLESVNASANTLDKVHRLTEFMQAHKQKEKDVAVRKLSYQSDKIDKMEKPKRDLDMQKHDNWYLDKTLNSSQHFDNTTKSLSTRKNSTQMPTSDSTSILKHPQIKLRMVPSEKESVVSINVDSTSTGLLDSSNPASNQLSVVVQSDKKQRSVENDWNAPVLRRGSKSASQRSDFGQMRISISENSAPVKQIEFSINGKPVSELKSITAKTEKLDVVSSMDKIEIRIPFAKDNANMLNKIREGDLSTEIGSNMGQILNLQISANFQNEPPKGNTEQSVETTNTISTLSPPSQTSKSNPSNSSRMDIKSDDIIENNISGDIDFKIQPKPMKNLSDDKETTNVLLTEEANNSEVGRSNTKERMSTIFPKTNKYNKKEFDPRVPTKIIPWWSSSNSFNKIKKEKDYYKPFKPSSNSKKKTMPNFNQNFTIDYLPSKSKQVSNSKTLTEETQSMNNATIITNDSTNLTSHSNFVEEQMKSKSTLKVNQLLYPNLFKLNTNQEDSDTTSEVTRNVSKTEDNQILTTKEGNKKVSEIKQTKPVMSSMSTVTNIQGEHDISTEENASILLRKSKASNSPSNSANNLSKHNREKKRNYSPKWTKPNDNISSAKSRTENILNVIKLTEKREDNILIDNGLTTSSKEPTVKLNNEIKYLQNLSPVSMKKNDSVSNKSTTLKVPKMEENNKTISVEQAKSNEEKKLEINTNILKEKEDLTVKNVAPIYIKTQNKNDSKNIKQIYKNNAMTSKYSDLQNSSKLTQMLKNQESLTANTIVLQDNSKQNLIKIQIKPDINPNKIVDTNKLSFSQTKPRSTSKIKYRAALKHSIDKNTGEMPVADQSADKLDVKVNEKDATAKIVTQNSKSKTPLPKNSKENYIHKLKSGKNRGNSSGSTDFLRKSNDSACFMSSDSKAHIQSRVTSNDNCTYAGELLFMDSYSNIDRKDDALSNSQPTTFKIPQNLNNIENMLEHHAPNVVKSTEPWTDMDRPEKSMLYSAWLQRFRNNINNNKKLFKSYNIEMSDGNIS